MDSMNYLQGVVIVQERLPARARWFNPVRPVIFRLRLDKCLARMLFDQLCRTGLVHESIATMWEAALHVFETSGEPDTYRYRLRFSSGGVVNVGRLYGVTQEKRAKGQKYEWRGALLTQPRVIKDSLFSFGYQGRPYIDFDQQKGHPNILLWIAERGNLSHHFISLYLASFDDICVEMIRYLSAPGEEPFDAGDVKDLFNITLYGGGWKAFLELTTVRDVRKPWAKKKVASDDARVCPEPRFWKPFAAEVAEITNALYEANPGFAAAVMNGTKWEDDALSQHVQNDNDLPSNMQLRAFREKKKRGRFMSFYLQQVEASFTELASRFAVEQGICNEHEYDQAHDGFTALPIKDVPDDFCDQMNAYVRERSGCPYVTFVRKAFKVPDIAQEVIERRRAMSDDEVAEYLKPRFVGRLREIGDEVPEDQSPFDLVGYFDNLTYLPSENNQSTKELAYAQTKAFFERSVCKVLAGRPFCMKISQPSPVVMGKRSPPRPMLCGHDLQFEHMSENEFTSKFSQYVYRFTDYIESYNEDTHRDEIQVTELEEAFLKRWKMDRTLKTVNGLSHFPWSVSGRHTWTADQKCEAYFANLASSLWVPFRYDLAIWSKGWTPKVPVADKLRLFFEHTSLICGDEDTATAFAIQWCAHMVQSPNVSGQFALVLFGTQGAGKSMWINILRQLLGMSKVCEPLNDNQVTGEFTSLLTNLILVALSEFETTKKGTAGAHKGLVTDSLQVINGKNKDAVQMPINCRLAYVSNSAKPAIRAEIAERRYQYTHASGRMKGDHEYLNRVDSLAVDEEFLMHLHYYLAHVDLSNYHKLHKPPMTSYHRELLHNTTPEYLDFLSEVNDRVFTPISKGKILKIADYEDAPYLKQLVVGKVSNRVLDGIPTEQPWDFRAYSKGEKKPGNPAPPKVLRSGHFWVSKAGLKQAWVEYAKTNLPPEVSANIGTPTHFEDKMLEFSESVTTVWRQPDGIVRWNIDYHLFLEKLGALTIPDLDDADDEQIADTCRFPLPMVATTDPAFAEACQWVPLPVDKRERAQRKKRAEPTVPHHPERTRAYPRIVETGLSTESANAEEPGVEGVHPFPETE